MQITEYSVVGLRSSVIDLRARGKPLRFRLFPMAHIGRAEFYREVAERLRDCDLIVSEGWDMPSSHGQAIVLAMRLTRQRGVRGLVHQDIDHAALGIPTVFPESVSGRRRRHRFSFWSLLDLLALTPYYTVVMALGGRNWLLRSRFEIDDNSDVRIRFMNKTFLHDRDEELISALAEVYEEHRERPEVVAVVYGAAHMPAVINALNARFGYRAVGAQWLTVFDEADLYRAVG
ncbi:hypothetical protein GPX89_24040 [Nocardia sp. ET3-3]|uniref:Uncharacterized protein n=1 Tax=Nocardia terrae TaxID=2675851 RepID=A0A7K1V101_9NOCA|nr:hypothetical protein [Nocardia terrae]MVU80306.1 hypothetical protein [Nocardia terrae]